MEEKQQHTSEFGLLLVRLDEEVSRYYNCLNSIRSVRASLQQQPITEMGEQDPDAIKKSKGVERFSVGILHQLDGLIGRLASLNDDVESEVKLLNDYI